MYILLIPSLKHFLNNALDAYFVRLLKKTYNTVFVTNHLDHVCFSEPLENRYFVFKKTECVV